MKKQKNKQGIKASKLAKAENKLKKQAEQIITVKNAEGEPDTQAKILIQNKINYTPKVSVIIPVYNVEEYLRECLDSVINQTLKEIEIICVDDGSTDNSLEILKEYAKKDNRISILIQKNSGSGKSRNNGINNSKGEFIAFMDSDDFYPSRHTLENMYTKACKYNVNICGGSLNQLKEGKIVTDPKLFEEGYIFKKEGVINYQDYQFDYGYWRFIYKRQFLRENQLYFPDYLRQQDPPFFIKAMAVAQKFYALVEATYVYRVSHKNIQWTERKVVDMFKGIEDSLNYSSKFDLDKLHILQALRINAWTFRTALAETIKYDAVREQALQAFQTIDFSLLKKKGITIELDSIYKAILESKNDALISVIIPVYNVEKYLSRCMDSVIAQTLKNLEIICINDGSTDNSAQILEDYAHKDKRIKIITQDNKGLSSARNVGIKQANCSFIYFIDSDDWIEKDTLEKAISKMTGNVDVVSWGANIINEGLDGNNRGIIVGNQYHKIKIKGQKNIDENVILQSTYTVWNKLFKKEIINKFKIKFAEGRLFEDNDFTIMYMLHCRSGYYLGEYLYNYSQRPNSIMEKVRAGKCDKVIDNLYIFDNLYKHCQKYCVLNKWRQLLTTRYLIHLRSAYLFAPINMKKQIREEATKLAKHYKSQMFTYPIVAKIQKKDYCSIRELNEIIISLTSYPARIGTVNQTIESLLNQSMKADKVILWLAPEQFPNKEMDLPQQLLDLRDKGLTIDWYHDIKSYKKLIPTLKKYPDAILVTADDDIIYPQNWLEKLYKSYTSDSSVIWCHRVHGIKLVKNKISDYKNWSHCLNYANASYLNFGTTGGGILFSPHCFYKDIKREDIFMKLTPRADDIWCWAMCVLNNKRIKLVPNNMSRLNLVENTQDNALWYDNVNAGMNDVQMNSIIKEYPQIMKILNKKQREKAINEYISFPFNLVNFIFLKKELRENYEKDCQNNIQTARIDIKNFGNENNAVEIATFAEISQPIWFANAQGKGQVVESNKEIQNLSIKTIRDGKLVLSFKGKDKRFDGTRFPVWIDYKSIKIDGKEILSAPIATWHDKPFRYEMPVKDGQIVKVDIVQQYHQYSKDELKDVILKLNPNSDYIKENIEKLTNKIYKKITVNNTTIKSSSQTTLFAKVKQNLHKYVNLWYDKFSFARKIEPVMDLMQKNHAQMLKMLQEIQAKNVNLENKNNELKKEIEVLKGAFNTQLSDFKKQQEERSKQLMAVGDKLSSELQRATNELQNAEQSQNGEIKATLSSFIAQLAETEAKLSSELQRATNELQNAEQSQNGEIKATLSSFIAQLAETEAKLSSELQRATSDLQNSGISDISQIKTYCADFAHQLGNTEVKLLNELNTQRETSQQNKNNIIAGINQTEQSLHINFTKFQGLAHEQLSILDKVQDNLNGLTNLKDIDFARQDELKALMAELDTQKSYLMSELQNLQNKAQRQYQELNFADLLHDSSHNSSWLKNKNFALYGWAANYSFIYTLFRILDNVKPVHILEMGLGQTSMVTSQYIANNKPEADLDIIENDEKWIKVYEPKLAKSQNIKLHQCDIEIFDYEGEQSRKYKELSNITKDKKYNLILVDGPFGGAQKFPRSNIVELVEKNLAQDFIIIFDDAERSGEQNTIARTKTKLTQLGIEFGFQQRNALKSQVLIFSKSCEFAKYL